MTPAQPTLNALPLRLSIITATLMLTGCDLDYLRSDAGPAMYGLIACGGVLFSGFAAAYLTRWRQFADWDLSVSVSEPNRMRAMVASLVCAVVVLVLVLLLLFSVGIPPEHGFRPVAFAVLGAILGFVLAFFGGASSAELWARNVGGVK